MPEAAPSPKRRSAIDTLVARDMTAVFWFLVAILTAAGCTWYINLMSQALSLQSSFVVMDTSGSFYVPPGVSFANEKIDSMHLMLADVVVETVLDRNREGLTYGERLPKIFQKPAMLNFRKYLDKEATYFRDQNVTQTFQIYNRKVTHRGITTVTTLTKGRVHRTYFLGGKPQETSYDFSIEIGWRMNKDISKNRNFPSQVEAIDIAELDKPAIDVPATEPPEVAPAAQAPKAPAQ